MNTNNKKLIFWYSKYLKKKKNEKKTLTPSAALVKNTYPENQTILFFAWFLLFFV